MPQASPKHVSCLYFRFYFTFNLARLFLGIVAASLMAVPSMTANMSDWSDRPVCGLVAGEPNSAEF